SRIEHFTHGQVNPFGMCFDPLFNIFTADCHTKPITQLLRGGYYQSFGKPHDGLGFVPEIMSHTHGTTANCGIVAYYGGHFPKEWEGMFFTGNVMTSRVNVDAPEYHGSTILAKERNDFVISKDAWFRPVDLQCGPDGALYIADFYNKIIGHYEVDLKHPGRDRHRGRIWKVIHRATPPFKMPDLRDANAEQLVKLLGHPNLTVRLLTIHRLCDGEFPYDVQVAVRNLLVDPIEEIGLDRRISALWIMPRRYPSNASRILSEEINRKQRDKFNVVPPKELRIHELKALANLDRQNSDAPLEEALRPLFHGFDEEKDAFAIRAAAEAFAKHHPKQSDLEILQLASASETVPEDDTHLRYTIRRAMCDMMKNSDSLEILNATFEDIFKDTRRSQVVLIAQCASTISTQEAGHFTLNYLSHLPTDEDIPLPFLQHATRFAPQSSTSKLAQLIRTRFANDLIHQLELLSSMRAALQQRGAPLDGSLRDWASELAAKLLDSSRGVSLSWANEVVPGKPKPDNPWELRARVSQDGDKGSLFFDSLVKGEQLTGLYRSEPFELPAKLSFWCAGHNGLPGAPFNPKNYIRLRDASTHALLREAMPPRNDTAQRIEWDLAEFVGQAFQPDPKAPRDVDGKKSAGSRSGQPGKADLRRGYVELLDADEASGYAWLAVGRFSVEALNPSRGVEQQIAAANLVADFKISNLKSQISDRLTSRDTDSRAKEAFARAVLALQPDSILSALAPLIPDVSLPETLREQMSAAIVAATPLAADAKAKLLLAVVQAIPERLQLRMAESLASDATGADALLRIAKEGHVSLRLLTRPTVKQRLDAIKSEGLHKQIIDLTSGLPDEDATLRKLVELRRTAFLSAQSNQETAQRPSLEAGATLFTKQCAACHQIAGKGTIVGPQLDGIGQRGLERVLEDVLDPNRNVDVNFRTTTVVTKDGKIFSGLSRREEGATLVLVDNKGKEFTVPLTDIDERVKSNLSLMPANVGEILTEREFLDLVSYLLSQRQKVEAKQ
ncbi:MAG: c-type cytochrome, partial [Planctomycetaceae bacterium]|nr:c-type cytochrome [Planctomycetaceae bacterium]